jgi:glycerophosphoryl diester phosphodiesterase
MGADLIELDLRMTSDGVFVAVHDATLDRTTGCPEWVRDSALEDIRELDAGSWFNVAHPELVPPDFIGQRVPTVAEVFERYGRSTKYIVELKDPHLNPGVEQKFVDLLRDSGMMDHALDGGVLTQSFDPASLARFRTIEPRLVRIRLFSLIQDKGIMIDEMAETSTYAAGIGPDKFNLDRDVVTLAHDHGLVVYPFTVDREAEMSALLDAGVDGIFTNYPDRFAALIAG